MAHQCITSKNCQSRKSRQRGCASATNGTSQTTNCGEYTLLVSTNAATTRNTSDAIRGRRGAVSASTAIPAQAAANSRKDAVLMNSGLRTGSCCRCAVRLYAYQMDE